MIHDAGADLLGSDSVCAPVCGTEEENSVNAFSNICRNINDVSISFLSLICVSLQNNSLVVKENGYFSHICVFFYPFGINLYTQQAHIFHLEETVEKLYFCV